MQNVGRFFLIVALSVAMLFLSACSSKKEEVLTHKKVLPSWYLNPPQTTQTTLYAIGEGESRDDAVKNALNMMASTLSVSISSQFSSKNLVEEGSVNSYSSSVSNEIQSDVKKIRISSYELINSNEIGFRKHIVLVKSEKEKLFLSLKNELEQKFTIIENEMKQLNRQHALEQLNIYKNAKENVADVPNTLIVMNVLNSAFNGSEYLAKIETLESGYANLLLEITFSIECDDESKNLEAVIRDGLSAKKMQVKKSGGEKHFYITLSSHIQKASSYGFTLAHSAIEITVKDYKNSIVGGNKLNISGQSTQGYEMAKESVAIKFGGMIKRDGIGKVIGLKL